MRDDQLTDNAPPLSSPPLQDWQHLPLTELIRGRLQTFVTQFAGKQDLKLYPMVMGEVEQALITLTMEFTQGNQLQAARILGMSRNTLRSKLPARGASESRSADKPRGAGKSKKRPSKP